jgi:hypothetical protein
MKVYEVECRAVVTLAAQDMQKAALHGAAVIKDNKPIMKRSLIVLALWALTAYHSNATAANLLFGRIGATLKTSQLTTQVWVEKRADMVNLAATEARQRTAAAISSLIPRRPTGGSLHSAKRDSAHPKSRTLSDEPHSMRKRLSGRHKQP